MKSLILNVAVAILVLGGGVARADPLRLRGDALVQTRSPVGLLVLSGEDRAKPWLDVETVTWLGAMGGAAPSFAGTSTPIGEPRLAADVLTLSVRARHQKSGSEVRAGRLLVSMGAVRPIHVDGARALARPFSTGTSLEVFGGIPVVRRFDYRAYSFAAGGRLGQAISDKAAFGASYEARRRKSGPIDDEEVGADLAITPSRYFTAAGRAAFDLLNRGPTDALGSVSIQNEEARLELFTTHRSPGRLLPSTSLFSMLGDVPATSAGGTVRYRAFPRLELLGTGSVQARGTEDVGGQGLGRVTLALDDEWASSIGLEARRVDFNGARWLGARAIVNVPLFATLRASSELELVRRDSGEVLPWGLFALAVSGRGGWDLAAAVEASSNATGGTLAAVTTSTSPAAVQMLARASYTFDRPESPRGSRGRR